MSWSPQQQAALQQVEKWTKTPKAVRAPVFRMFGFAGTGKTTLAKEIAGLVKGRALYATFAGKAAQVLRTKGCEGAQTIHSLIYSVTVDPETGEAKFSLNDDSDLRGAALLIVDEVSMVGELLAKDLLSFKTPILVLGDPAQLPPVKDEGFFINAAPDVMLTEVHRQARDNPIIRMSMDIREGRRLMPGQYDGSIVARRKDTDRGWLGERVRDADQVLVGLNKSRETYNRRIRQMKGLAGADRGWHPAVGDRLICLKNNRERAVFNGSMWEASRVDFDGAGALEVVVNSLDEKRDPFTAKIYEEFFNGTQEKLEWRERQKSMEFTYGWAITCHKSQGSQWDDVVVFDESGAFREAQRNWLYTAVTRAAEKVTVII